MRTPSPRPGPFTSTPLSSPFAGGHGPLPALPPPFGQNPFAPPSRPPVSDPGFFPPHFRGEDPSQARRRMMEGFFRTSNPFLGGGGRGAFGNRNLSALQALIARLRAQGRLR